MRIFRYYQPTEILFGCGRLNGVGAAVSRWGKRCLLVTVPEFPEFSPLYKRVQDLLKASGVDVAHFDGVMPTRQPT